MNKRKYFSGLIRTIKVTHSALDPAEREVNLNLGGDQDDSDEVITVTDLSGRIELTRKAEGDRIDAMTIDISGIAGGIYLVQISSGPHSEHMKLLVTH